MPQKKIKLMFDATIFFNAINKGSNRSGIFFTAYQVAKRLAKHPDVDLLFYCSPNKIKKLLESINEECNKQLVDSNKAIPDYNLL